INIKKAYISTKLADIRKLLATLQYLMTLFPRKLFNDSLPQIVFKHQLYSLHSDKTLVDKYLNFFSGRKAVLGMVKKSKYNEILKNDLQERRTTSHVKLDIKYHIHDIIGAELVECIQTTSGTLLRFVDT
uniref:Serine/threonine kinase 19 n=1 Tax=Astyanax mexicanus TaxID=7994 RepID=A0A8B9JE20_ASTMX